MSYESSIKLLHTLIEKERKKYPNNDCTTGIFSVLGRPKNWRWIYPCKEPLRTAIINYKKAIEDVGKSSFEPEDVNEDYNNKLHNVNESISQLEAKAEARSPVSLGGKRRRRSTKRGRRKSLRRRKTVRK
jgi:hypothetical protein